MEDRNYEEIECVLPYLRQMDASIRLVDVIAMYDMIHTNPDLRDSCYSRNALPDGGTEDGDATPVRRGRRRARRSAALPQQESDVSGAPAADGA